ncbi:MAG TPA: YggS family pyridoxal phosphate-dependent enzyme [Treponema sp.]|nr:YggS family pyridoxal phosphate-dependent enzyme [Treponema sp.]
MSIHENLNRIKEEIHDVEIKTGRSPGSVSLVAVSKFHPDTAVVEALKAGQLLFGENRVQEAEEKFSRVLQNHQNVELHMIGNLQRNKVATILPLASCIQSLDRIELLKEIEKRAKNLNKTISVLFELHTGEATKAGFASKESLFPALDLLAVCPHVHCSGLMTMAPFTTAEQEIRASFSSLKSMQNLCEQAYPDTDFSVLSMGMSNDYRIAIEEGSTMLRIGTAIFGDRRV